MIVGRSMIVCLCSSGLTVAGPHTNCQNVCSIVSFLTRIESLLRKRNTNVAFLKLNHVFQQELVACGGGLLKMPFGGFDST